MSKKACVIIIVLVVVSTCCTCISLLDRGVTENAASNNTVKNYIDENNVIHLGEEYDIVIKDIYNIDDNLIVVTEFTNNTSQYENYMMNICCKAYQNDRQLEASYIDADEENDIDKEIRNGESTQVLEKFKLNGATGNVELHFRKGFTDADSDSVIIGYALE